VNWTKPAAIRTGDTIGFISPASYLPIDIPQYKKNVIEAMTRLGLQVRWADHAFDRWGYLAGTDAERAQDVMTMFTDPTVKAIIANRGGWGCNRIIDTVRPEKVLQFFLARSLRFACRETRFFGPVIT
jgi:muramoyltetrapeptide carboxypeptidase